MQLKQAQETTQATKIAEHQHTLTFAQRGNARCDICRKSCGRGAYTYYCAGCDFDACQECVASRRPSSVTGAFRLNQRVKCKDSGDSSWKQGVVTSVSPLKVQCDGWADSFTWDQVERVDGTGGQQTTAQAPRTREPPPRRRLTTGDTVVICSGATKAGQRGTIIKDDGPSDNKPYKVQFRDGETGWYRAAQVSRELGRPTCGPKHNAVVRIANGSHRGGQLALIIEDDHSETPYKVRFKDSKTRWYKEAEVHWCSEPEMRSAPRADRADLVSLAKAVGGVAHFVGEGEINQAMGFVADAIKTGDIAVAAGRAGAGAVKGAIISTAAELVSEGLAEAGLTTAAAAVLGAEHGLILGPGGALLGARADAAARLPLRRRAQGHLQRLRRRPYGAVGYGDACDDAPREVDGDVGRLEARGERGGG